MHAKAQRGEETQVAVFQAETEPPLTRRALRASRHPLPGSPSQNSGVAEVGERCWA